MTTDLTTLLAEATEMMEPAGYQHRYRRKPILDEKTKWSHWGPHNPTLSSYVDFQEQVRPIFAAASRDLIPRLVAACREQMAEIERLQEALDELRTSQPFSTAMPTIDDCHKLAAQVGMRFVPNSETLNAALQPAGKDTP